MTLIGAEKAVRRAARRARRWPARDRWRDRDQGGLAGTKRRRRMSGQRCRNHAQAAASTATRHRVETAASGYRRQQAPSTEPAPRLPLSPEAVS
jgi:hypothetical protein